jgi:Fe-S-cluster containining protein
MTVTRQPAPKQNIPAGDFSVWLRQIRKALRDDSATDVACGDCVGCCSSSYFILIRSHETATLARVPKEALVAAPGQPPGHRLMGHDKQGLCPMLVSGKCSIYPIRPQTCRTYDCRIFTAAGVAAGGAEKATINQRVSGWRFSYPTQQDRDEHEAVQRAARFMQEHASSFPGGRRPSRPTEIAVMAIKVYEVFLRHADSGDRPDEATATAVIETCKRFDRTASG